MSEERCVAKWAPTPNRFSNPSREQEYVLLALFITERAIRFIGFGADASRGR